MNVNMKNIQSNNPYTTLKEQLANQLSKEQEVVQGDTKKVTDPNDPNNPANKSLNNALRDPEEEKKFLGEVTQGMNKMMNSFDRKLDFVVHEGTGSLMVKVIDTNTNKVIREIPPEEVLDLAARMKEAFSIFFDVKV